MSGGLITALIVVVALVLFLSVIMIHEFGHFLFAKLFGVKVNEFSVGMGPRLFKKKGKETVYSFRLLPIGGFCAMEGEDEDSSDERAFNKKKVWKRIIIVAAGAIFNIILGFIFMFIITAQEDAYVSNTIAYTLTPVSAADVEMLSEAKIPLLQSTDINGGIRYFCQSNTLLTEEQYSALKVDGTQTVKDMLYTEKDESGKQNYYFGKQAGENDLRLGDEILSVNGYHSYCFNDAYFAMSLDSDGVMDMEVLRDGKKVNIKKEFIQVPTEFEGTYQTIIDFRVFSIEKTFGTVLEQTWFESLFFVRSVYVSLFRLVTCQSGFNEMSGPVGIATVIGEAAEVGFSESFMTGINNILRIMALITFNLGIFNLLPIPALDGGRLVFLYIEGIRRKPINPKYEGVIHFIGLLLFFALIIAVTFNDVSRLITNCVG